jgi:hypothetical protein
MAPRCVGWRPLQPALLREAVRDGRMALATGGGRADSGDAVGRDGRTEALTSGGLVALDRGLGLSGVGETDD